MLSSFTLMIESTTAKPAAGTFSDEITEPFTYFIHREDSEPDRVAPRNRLAPTQPLPSSPFALTRPTESEVNGLFRSSLKYINRSKATVVAPTCDFASRPTCASGDTPRRQLLGGRQTDGFRRTISYDKNQRGVREHLT